MLLAQTNGSKYLRAICRPIVSAVFEVKSTSSKTGPKRRHEECPQPPFGVSSVDGVYASSDLPHHQFL